MKKEIDQDPKISPDESSGHSRRQMFRMGGAAALAGAVGAFGASLTAEVQASAPGTGRGPTPKPVYFPRQGHVDEIDMAGKFVVITGASRGIGRATAELLASLGATVVGTSRNVAGVSNPPSTFTLLDLDITSEASVNAFLAQLVSLPTFPGQIDALINNAGRFVFGTLVPPPIAPDPLGFFLSQSNLAMETLYGGHMRVTNTLLPLMNQAGEGRILFTASVVAYGAGGTEAGEAQGQSFLSVYYSGKRALLAYANTLRGFLKVSGSTIQVSTVNPFAVNTGLALGNNPIFTEPVDAQGNSPFNPVLQAVVDGTRLFLANGLPAEFAAQAYRQLLTASSPRPNVVVGSPREPLATMGGTELILGVARDENGEAAMRF